MLLEGGRSRYNIPIDIVRVAIVEVDDILYDSDGGIKIEDSIRRILVKVDLEDNMKGIYK